MSIIIINNSVLKLQINKISIIIKSNEFNHGIVSATRAYFNFFGVIF